MKFSSLQEPRIVYLGTPEISASILEKMVENGCNIVALVTNEDKEVGRKKILEPTPTKKVALAHNIPVFQPHRIRLDNSFLPGLNADVIVCMAYGQIVPLEVLNAPKYGCINLHGSLLPLLRGAAPIQRAIMNGDKLTGVTLMQMVDKMDAGLMYDKKEVVIEENDNFSSLAKKTSDAGAELIIKDLLPYLNGELPGLPQDESLVTIAKKISPEDEKIPLSINCREFVNYVRGLSLTPGGYLLLNDEKLKIYAAHQVSSSLEAELGTIIKDKKEFLIQLNDGVISLDEVQLQGHKVMDAASFLNGSHGLLGQKLS